MVQAPTPNRPSRLTPADRSKELAPFRKAESALPGSLYWAPAPKFPVPDAQRAWFLDWIGRLTSTIELDLGLRTETFLNQDGVNAQLDAFTRTAVRYMPMAGLWRRPAAPLGAFPDEETIRKMQELFQQTGKEPDFSKFVDDSVYWFIAKEPVELRETFFGRGGWICAMLPPDPASAPPEMPIDLALLQDWGAPEGLERTVAAAFALKDSFLEKSKQVFGKGLENDGRCEAVPFLLPRLGAREILGASSEDFAECFGVFEVYLRESPEDGGVILASKHDLDEILIEILEQMRAEGRVIPG